MVDRAATIRFDRPTVTENSKNHVTDSDSARRPTVERVPSGPVAAASAFVADRLLRRTVSRLPLRVVYPDGTQRGGGEAESPVLVVNNPDRLNRRLGRHGLVGFGESFMAAEWESTDLVGVLTALAPTLSLAALRGPRRPRPGSSQPTRAEAMRTIAAHYDDLSSDLFIEFLDETMTYSSAWFDRLPATWSDLADAQRRKIDRLLDAARVGPGTRLLEIGSGWGELSIRAAARGAKVRSVTPSEQQRWLARQRAAAAGKSDRVRIEVCDYHDIAGCYDAVISVEMVEAVGHRSWSDFLCALEGTVKPGGRVVLQSVAMPHAQMLAGRNRQTWTQKYIFPGGQIPSAKALLETAERRTTLRPTDMVSLGEHYAETLRMWRERFMQRRKTLGHIGFDDVFARMWELYLASREAGFRSGNLNVYQWTFVNRAAP